MNYDLVLTQIKELDHSINFLKLTHSLPEKFGADDKKLKI